MKSVGKSRAFWSIALTVFLTDCTTKAAIVANLSPSEPIEVLGDIARLNLTFNTNAAMGIDIGPYAAVLLSTLGLIMIALMLRYYRQLPTRAVALSAALAFLVGGALGNVVDRMAGAPGVVDFIDVGVGSSRFWTFNLADVAIFVGAILFMILARASGKPQERDAA